jgi:hypothetical protein
MHRRGERLKVDCAASVLSVLPNNKKELLLSSKTFPPGFFLGLASFRRNPDKPRLVHHC